MTFKNLPDEIRYWMKEAEVHDWAVLAVHVVSFRYAMFSMGMIK